LAYTGWFATVANKLIPDDIEYVCFLEYDTDLINVEDFNVMLKNVFIEDKEVYGMFNLPISNSFLDNSIFSKGLIDFLKANGYREIKPNNEKWIVSNNAIFKKDALHKFFECPMTINLLNYLNVDRMAGHFLERYLSVYCFIKNVEFGFINPCCFVHAALDSHNTQNRKDGPEGYERFKANYQISDKE